MPLGGELFTERRGRSSPRWIYVALPAGQLRFRGIGWRRLRMSRRGDDCETLAINSAAAKLAARQIIVTAIAEFELS